MSGFRALTSAAKRTIGWFSIGCLAVGLPAAPAARAETPQEFYSKHPVSFYIGYPPGAAYDIYARLVGRFIGKHIPGQPTVVMRNMPGASSLILANALAHTLPRDGSAFGALFERIGLEPLVGSTNARFDGTKFGWLGSVLKVTDVCMFWHTIKAKTIEDARHQEVIIGTAGNAGNSAMAPRILNAFLGTRFKLVGGYGGADLFLAMERGETQARCGMSWGGLKASKPDWLAEKKINIVIQTALKKHPELPDVPLIMDLIHKPEDRTALEYLFATQEMGRPFATPPGVPEDRIAALRQAFDQTMRDPEFLEAARQSNLDIDPIPGTEVQAIMERLYGTPREVIERVEMIRGVSEAGAAGSR
jgi:tripartite-type tricarboxylate transporter receptor subunit TctC